MKMFFVSWGWCGLSEDTTAWQALPAHTCVALTAPPPLPAQHHAGLADNNTPVTHDHDAVRGGTSPMKQPLNTALLMQCHNAPQGCHTLYSISYGVLPKTQTTAHPASYTTRLVVRPQQ